MGRKGKIERSAALQQKILRYHKKGLGSRAISTKLEKQGYEMSHMTIYKWIKKVTDEQKKVLESDKYMIQYAREQVFDTVEQLRRVNNILWEMIDGRDGDVSRKFKLETIKELRSTIQLAEGIMNKFQGLEIDARGSDRVEVIQIVVNQLHKMEERGDIKILNPKLRKESHDAEYEEIEDEDDEHGKD